MMKQLSWSWLALLVGVAGVAHADPIFIESRLKLRVEAAVVPDVPQWQVDDHYQTGDYGDMTASATAVSNTGNGVASAFSSGGITWDSSANGHLSFGDTGFFRSIAQENGTADLNDSGWSYTFITQEETTFVLDFWVDTGSVFTDTNGLYGFTLAVMQGEDMMFAQDMDLGTADSIAVALDPGETYTVVIIPNAEIDDATGLGISSMQANFDWEIY